MRGSERPAIDLFSSQVSVGEEESHRIDLVDTKPLSFGSHRQDILWPWKAVGSQVQLQERRQGNAT